MEKWVADAFQDPELKAFQDQLIYKRNISMAQQLETYMATPKKYFVVVGAGHLVGDRSFYRVNSVNWRGNLASQVAGEKLLRLATVFNRRADHFDRRSL